VAGFFDPLLAWIDRAVADGFLRPEDRGLLRAAGRPDDLLDLLQHDRPAIVSPKWIQESNR
jgi:hypothetical protein